MESIKIIVGLVTFIMFITSMFLRCRGYVKEIPLESLPRMLSNPFKIVIVGLFIFSSISFSETIYYHAKYNPTEKIFYKNSERKNLKLFPVTESMIPKKHITKNFLRFIEKEDAYKRIEFANPDSLKSKHFSKFILFNGGNISTEADIYKVNDRNLALIYDYLNRSYEYRYYLDEQYCNHNCNESVMTFYGHGTCKLQFEKEIITRQMFFDTLKHWKLL